MAKNEATATSPEAPAEVKAAAETKTPADPRLKLLKKFYGKFLPKGPLRDRYKDIMDRWNSGPEHGGVTNEEIKKLLDEWKAVRENRRRSLRPKA